ncbi:MAG: orotidine-5'-phosphate decarboxylase [Pyrinomonadaceae bacterium]
MKDKLIIALDVPTRREALRLVAELRGAVGMFKVGSQLFTAAGPDVVREIVAAGERVFLDLKFHDIPNTVAAACVEAARLGVSLINVHALGGAEMMRRAVEIVDETTRREALQRPAIIAVTVLTSADVAALEEVGLPTDPQTQVIKLARLADACGLNGVVASPHEIAVVRAQVARQDFIIVTPGVRPIGISHDDQKRVMTPAAAIRAGADYLVVGRAILRAADPARAAAEIVAEISQSAQPSVDSPDRARTSSSNA